MSRLRRFVRELPWSVPPARLWTPSALLSGIVAVVTLTVLGVPFPGIAALASVTSRPTLALSVLVGPTGLTFPCWAATRTGRGETVPSSVPP